MGMCGRRGDGQVATVDAVDKNELFEEVIFK